jgi:hypothetical protein
MIIKKCSRCLLEKDISEFSKDKHRNDGIDTRCKSCKGEMVGIWRAEKKISKYGLLFPFKGMYKYKVSIKCSVCQSDKPVSEFYGSPGKYRQPCKECYSAKYIKPHKAFSRPNYKSVFSRYIDYETKICPKCESPKNVSEYYKSKDNPDFLSVYCKDCVRELNGQKKRISKYIGSERLCVKCNKYKNISAFSKNSSTKDGLDVYCKSCVKSNGKKWYEKNAERERQKRRAYSKSHREVFNAAAERRRARIAGIEGSFTGEEFIALCGSYGNVCLACGASGGRLHADHVVPVFLGGKNSIDNIQPLCKRCNSSKGKLSTADYRIKINEAKY